MSATPEPLTPAQLAELTADLEALKGELAQLITDMGQSAGTVDLDQPIGRLSRVDALQNQQIAAANRRRTEQRLQQVLAALARVREGEYGVCLASGDPIGYKRLKARPETPFSLEAQARIEQRRL